MCVKNRKPNSSLTMPVINGSISITRIPPLKPIPPNTTTVPSSGLCVTGCQVGTTNKVPIESMPSSRSASNLITSDLSSSTTTNTGKPKTNPITSRMRFHSISEFRPSELLKSKFQVLGSGPDVISRQELESLVDVKKREPTKGTKEQIKAYAKKYNDFQSTEKSAEKLPWYKEAAEYTQPAHLVAIVAVLFLAFRLFPDSRRHASEASTLTRLLYISSASTVFGTQMWMTFVSGLALFFSVPRHVFAQVQQVLFPNYFLWNSALMLVSVFTYTQQNPTHMWDTHQCIQGVLMVSSFVINLIVWLYLAPVLTKLITIKMAIEREAGIGKEVGSSRPGVLAHCPHYMKLHRAFRKIHMIIAACNMASVAATWLHLYYLATKLCSVQL